LYLLHEVPIPCFYVVLTTKEKLCRLAAADECMAIVMTCLREEKIPARVPYVSC
jgi:hypothetical protein